MSHVNNFILFLALFVATMTAQVSALAPNTLSSSSTKLSEKDLEATRKLIMEHFDRIDSYSEAGSSGAISGVVFELDMKLAVTTAITRNALASSLNSLSRGTRLAASFEI